MFKIISIPMLIILFYISTTNIYSQLIIVDTNNKPLSVKVSLENPTIRLVFGLANSSYHPTHKIEATNNFHSYELGLGLFNTYNFSDNDWDVVFKTIISDNTSSTNAKHPGLGSYSYSGLFFSYMKEHNPDWIGSNLTEMYSFGFSDLKGSGYNISKNSAIKLLYGSNIMWAFLNHAQTAYTEQNRDPDFEYLADGIRFGNRYQSEINYEIYKGISVLANANRSVIYPHFLFGKWLGNYIIYNSCEGILSWFTNKIKKSSPNAYPVADFILKTGLYFGMTELQKKKVNWPFESGTPLMIDQYRAGIQITF